MRLGRLTTLAMALALGTASAAAQPTGDWKIGDRLIGTSWQAATIGGSAVDDPKAATLEFIPGDHVRGQAGCNRFVGPFASRQDKITMGPLRTTKTACPAAEAAVAEKLIWTLHRVQRVEVSEQLLVLHGGAGSEPSRFVPAAK